MKIVFVAVTSVLDRDGSRTSEVQFEEER